MNGAQVEEREIKERTAKEIGGKRTNVVEEEWRELLRDALKIQKRNERGGLQ